MPMKKRLIPVLLLIAALLLTAIAPAETTAPETACPGCTEDEIHRSCETCGKYSCENDYFTEKHGALCPGCGERFCGPYRQKGHTACPCGALSCTEDYNPADHQRCACGVYACRDPLFEINHAPCKDCGVKICDIAYGRHSHKLCSGCGMRKCNPEYHADAHDKCNGCRELLCVSENDHTSCPRCNRYVCKAMDNYHKFDHTLDRRGWPNCLEYIEEPEPLTPPVQAEATEHNEEQEPPEQPYTTWFACYHGDATATNSHHRHSWDDYCTIHSTCAYTCGCKS